MEHGSGNHIVEYTYDKEGGVSTSTPVVQDGIVIQNATDGNEFVWVPVGVIKNDAVANTTNKTTITLGRYSNFTVAEDGTLPTPAQTASKTDYDAPTRIGSYTSCIEISSDFAGGTFGEETYSAASRYFNTKLTSTILQEWVSTTLDNGGYYIARYEASKNGEKAASKATIVDSTNTTNATITDGMLWNNISQGNAYKAAEAMYPYSSSEKCYSELINSYAWDTAIIFIEAFSDSNYATQNGHSINSRIAKTGENADKVCNIQDMAGNLYEWSTETCVNSGASCCSIRGGHFSSGVISSGRTNSSGFGDASFGFRITLCVK